MINIHEVLAEKFGHRKYCCRGQGINADIEYFDELSPITKEELRAAETELKAEKAAAKYREDRLKEYPTAEELTVAMWEAQVEGRPELMNELQAKRLKIKQKFPKPEA
jgi:hypothetical protein